MLEGKLYYRTKEDKWILIDEQGREFNVSGLIYGLVALGGHFNDDAWVGEGEHFKVALEVNHIIQEGPLSSKQHEKIPTKDVEGRGEKMKDCELCMVSEATTTVDYQDLIHDVCEDCKVKAENM